MIVLDLAYIPFHHDTNKSFMHIFTSMCICACIACVCMCVCVCAEGTLTIFINLFWVGKGETIFSLKV